MFQQHLTNSETFKKYRHRNARPLSDLDIVCRGKLIESNRAPEKFYNGWYPIRHRCSFPQHENLTGAGLKSKTDLKFRNYKVTCAICDHPDNQPLPVKNTSWGCNLFPGLNSVAPKSRRCFPSSDVAAQAGSQKASCSADADRPWRYHDPRPWQPSNVMPSKCQFHHRNWFRDQIDGDNKYSQSQKAYRKCAQRLRAGSRDCKMEANTGDKKYCQEATRNSASNVATTQDTSSLPTKCSDLSAARVPQSDM